jgi:pyruvate dehydrogenase E2 component (dihydrolipoamide acetyltransferase)
VDIPSEPSPMKPTAYPVGPHETMGALFSTIVLGTEAPPRITAKVVRASAQVLLDHPDLNGTRAGGAFRPADHADVSVTLRCDAGLVAPVVRNPASKSVDEVAGEIASLAVRASAGELTPADLVGGTFSVTNMGAWGVETFTPKVEADQVAAIGVGAIRAAPLPDENGALAVVAQLTLSAAFNRAFVSDDQAAAFLQQLASNLSG